MIDESLFLHTFSLLAPFFTAATCFILVGFSLHDCLTLEERKLKKVLLAYLLFNSLVWVSLFCYYFVPVVFGYLISLFLVVHILSPLFFFRILCNLMKKEFASCFSLCHYIGPILIGMGGLVWSFFFSFDAQELVKEKIVELIGDGLLYAKLLSSPISIIRAIFVAVYYSLFVRQLIRYSRWVLGPNNPIGKPSRWILYLLLLSLFPLFFSFAALFQSPNRILSGFRGALAAIGAFVQIIMITFHIVRRRYLLYRRKVDETPQELAHGGDLFDPTRRRVFSGALTQERLEAWFRLQKPYLKVDFKITDIMKEMDVNRTVVSSFINKTYGMNFSRFVNRWRIEEFERLIAQFGPDSKLHLQAGFSEIRQYHRAVATERKATGKTVHTDPKKRTKND